MIATAGALSAEMAATIAKRLVADDGRVTVITVVEVPHEFLEDLDGTWQPSDPDVDPATEYLEEKGHRLAAPLLAALEVRGMPAESQIVEGPDPAEAIVKHARERSVDIVVMGATKQLFEEWDSITSRVTAEFGGPVVVLPPKASDEKTD